VLATLREQTAGTERAPRGRDLAGHRAAPRPIRRGATSSRPAMQLARTRSSTSTLWAADAATRGAGTPLLTQVGTAACRRSYGRRARSVPGEVWLTRCGHVRCFLPAPFPPCSARRSTSTDLAPCAPCAQPPAADPCSVKHRQCVRCWGGRARSEHRLGSAWRTP